MISLKPAKRSDARLSDMLALTEDGALLVLDEPEGVVPAGVLADGAVRDQSCRARPAVAALGVGGAAVVRDGVRGLIDP